MGQEENGTRGHWDKVTMRQYNERNMGPNDKTTIVQEGNGTKRQ